jgi:hypothetical protein
MDKATLKKLIKPIVKECIREVLMEVGAETMLSEVKTPAPVRVQEVKAVAQPKQQESKALTENKKKLLDEIGKSGYMSSRFDPFAGTKPLTEAQASNGVAAGPMSQVDASDPGIDTSSLFSQNSNKWKALVNAKGK